MRVRLLELRLLAVGLAVLWAIVAVLLLAGYRPGGPADLLVGLAALATARGRRRRRRLAPGRARRPGLPDDRGARRRHGDRPRAHDGAASSASSSERGLQTLLPSPEAAYPWVLAILGTSLFAGLGIARRLLRRRERTPGPACGRPSPSGSGSRRSRARRWRARRSRTSSRCGTARRPPPATGRRTRTCVPPLCDGPLAAGATARPDPRPRPGPWTAARWGSPGSAATRSGRDFRWLAEVTTTRDVGLHGAAAVGSRAWIRQTGTRWLAGPVATARGRIARPRGPRGRPRPGAAHRRGGSRPRLRRGRPGPPLPRRRGRDHLPRRVPPGPLAGRGRRPRGLARARSTPGSSPTASSAAPRDALAGPGSQIAPGAIRGELSAILTATHRGGPVTVAPPTN